VNDFDFECVFGFDYLDFKNVQVWFAQDIVLGINQDIVELLKFPNVPFFFDLKLMKEDLEFEVVHFGSSLWFTRL